MTFIFSFFMMVKHIILENYSVEGSERGKKID